METTNIAFGTGICMQNNWDWILKYFRPDYLADNNQDKWFTFPMGGEIECIPPEKISTLPNPRVMITIGDPYVVEKIREQLECMNLSGEAVTDFIGGWGEREELSGHLNRIRETVGNERILLLNSPEHDNIGDHLISVAELAFIRKYLPGYECIEITDMDYLRFHSKVKEYITQKDIILITGGGFLGSLWLYNGELNVRHMIQSFPENQIMIMPQTIFFEDNLRGIKEREKTAEIYKRHKNLTVCLREQASYRLAKEMLGENGRCLLLPDMALFLNYSHNQTERNGVLLCLRKDKEGILNEKAAEEMITALEKRGKEYAYTLMHTGKCFDIKEREAQLAEKAAQMKAAELVVTDTLHGMLLCAITGTPCMAFDNLSHKVSGVYEWIRHLPYIHLYKEGENVDINICCLLENGAGSYNEQIFMEYYQELAWKIGEQ